MTLGSLALFTFGVLYRSAQGSRKVLLLFALVLIAGVDRKVFGTSLRVNAATGSADRFYRTSAYPGMKDETFWELAEHRDYRVVSDLNNSSVLDAPLGLSTPQGFDPLVPRNYLLAIKGSAADPWLDLDASNRKDLLRLSGRPLRADVEKRPGVCAACCRPGFPLDSAGQVILAGV